MTKFLALILYIILNSDGSITPMVEQKYYDTEQACKVTTAQRAKDLDITPNRQVIFASCGRVKVVEASKQDK